jgi:hypothetical protein
MYEEVYQGIFTGHNTASIRLNLPTIYPHRTTTPGSMKVKKNI